MGSNEDLGDTWFVGWFVLFICWLFGLFVCLFVCSFGALLNIVDSSCY